MAEIKLTYFNATGRAELSRLILAYAGVEYEDERVTGAQFREMKKDRSKIPYDQLPVLCHNGTVIGQSMTIARFLACEYGLSGRTNLEQAQANEVVDALCDIQNKGFECMVTPADQKAAVMEKLCDTVDKALTQLEYRLDGRGGQFFAGNSLTWADLQLHDVIGLLCGRLKLKLNMDKFPKLVNLNSRVGELPNIKKWGRPAHDPEKLLQIFSDIYPMGK